MTYTIRAYIAGHIKIKQVWEAEIMHTLVKEDKSKMIKQIRGDDKHDI